VQYVIILSALLILKFFKTSNIAIEWFAPVTRDNVTCSVVLMCLVHSVRVS